MIFKNFFHKRFLIRIEYILVFVILAFLACNWTPGYAQSDTEKLIFPSDTEHIEIPFTRYRGWIVIEVKINGSKSYRFILDTGAPIAVLASAGEAARIKLSMIGFANVSGADPGNPERVPLAGSVTFQLGSLQITHCMMAVGMSGSAIDGVDGIIGKYVFSGVIVHIDWIRQKLIICKPACPHFRFLGDTIPLQILPSGHITTRISVQQNDQMASLTADLDIGNRSCFTVYKSHPEETISRNYIRHVIVGWGVNGPLRGDLTRTRLAIGSSVFDQVITAFSEPNPAISRDGIEANLGISVLERFNLTFDYGRKILILERNVAYSMPFDYTHAGLIFNPKNQLSLRVVADVIVNSPAWNAGIKTGDTLLSVNNMTVLNDGEKRIDSLLNNDFRHPAMVLLKRKDSILRVQFITRKII